MQQIICRSSIGFSLNEWISEAGNLGKKKRSLMSVRITCINKAGGNHEDPHVAAGTLETAAQGLWFTPSR
jgi:hypothetical protein